jgi:hypothetical protein
VEHLKAHGAGSSASAMATAMAAGNRDGTDAADAAG